MIHNSKTRPAVALASKTTNNITIVIELFFKLKITNERLSLIKEIRRCGGMSVIFQAFWQ